MEISQRVTKKFKNFELRLPQKPQGTILFCPSTSRAGLIASWTLPEIDFIGH